MAGRTRVGLDRRTGGFTPPGMPTRAIRGHEFGLKLTHEERADLSAFLRTL
jgi:hypothetical protein